MTTRLIVRAKCYIWGLVRDHRSHRATEDSPPRPRLDNRNAAWKPSELVTSLAVERLGSVRSPGLNKQPSVEQALF